MSNQTEELLQAGMARFTADVDVPPNLATRTATAARRRQRRKRAGAAATAIGAASLAAVTAVLVTGSATTPGPSPRTASPRAAASRTAPSTRTAAYVISHTQAALAATSSQNVIEYARQTATGSMRIGGPGGFAAAIVSWTYRGQNRTAAFAANGRLNADEGTKTTGSRTTGTFVSYGDKTWFRTSIPSTTSPEPTCDYAVMLSGLDVGLNDWSRLIRAALSCGQYTIAGTGQVAGVQAVELKSVNRMPTPFTTVFWVDPATYLPVRDVVNYGDGTVQIDFRWLQPSQAHLADLVVPIPPSFTRVPPPLKLPF